jgi:hypothetical protein
MSSADYRSAHWSVLLAASVCLAGCGYIGGPLAPLANVPARILDVQAVQRGGTIIIHFTLPLKTTENVNIKEPLTLDLRIGTGVGPFNADRWAEQAKQIPPPKTAKGLVQYEVPSAEWTGKIVTIGVRTAGANGKPSEWSNMVQVQAVPPPAMPTGVHGESTPAGIRLAWEAGGDHFHVLRRTAGEQSYSLVGADVRTPEFVDPGAAVGTEYTYLVQSFVPLAPNPEAQSDLSEEYKITRQAQPPATPAGLLGIPSADSIELNWDSNAGPETTGYRIYRAAPGGDFVKIGEVSAVPTYSDRAAEHGKTYRYAVTAIDKDGRESQRSAVVEVILP